MNKLGGGDYHHATAGRGGGKRFAGRGILKGSRGQTLHCLALHQRFSMQQ